MNKEILEVTESVSNEKCLPREKIFEALETALTIATKKKYEKKIDVIVKINRKNGNFYTYRRWLVVKKVKYPKKEININNIIYKNIKIGDFIEKKIKSIIFNRITTQTAKQIILQKMREEEKKIIIKKFKKKIGKIITGNIKKINKELIIIDIGSNTDAFLKKKDMILKEKFRLGNRIKVLLYKIKKKKKGYNFLLSRSKKEIIIELLKIEIPEIKEKIIEIKSIARNPGSRTKIAVNSKDKYIDPIGACIGIKGSRIQAISNELCGEKIDIILWNKNPIKFVKNAMSPAEISSILINKKKHSMNINVKSNNLAQAIGKNGQNVKLATKLTGWNINISSLKNKKIISYNEIKIKKKNIYISKNLYSLINDKILINKLILNSVFTLEKFANFSIPDLKKIDNNIDSQKARNLIMTARNICWFKKNKK